MDMLILIIDGFKGANQNPIVQKPFYFAIWFCQRPCTHRTSPYLPQLCQRTTETQLCDTKKAAIDLTIEEPDTLSNSVTAYPISCFLVPLPVTVTALE